MRRIMALTAAVGLLGGLGCTHEVCDCCQDICGQCQYPGCGSRAVAVSAPLPAPAPAAKPDSMKQAPKPAAESTNPATDAPKAKDGGKKAEGASLDD